LVAVLAPIEEPAIADDRVDDAEFCAEPGVAGVLLVVLALLPPRRSS